MTGDDDDLEYAAHRNDVEAAAASRDESLRRLAAVVRYLLNKCAEQAQQIELLRKARR